MHPTQQKLLKLAGERDLGKMKLLEMGRLVGVDHPQVVKYHLAQLQKRGLINLDRAGGTVKRIEHQLLGGSDLVAIPIYGSANAGPQTLYADDRLEGYLKVSSGVLGTRRNLESLLALHVVGDSMDRAHVGPDREPIDDGDYVIVDRKQVDANDGDYVVSIIDGMANIKKFRQQPDNIYLISESNRDLPPIVLHKDDSLDLVLAGKVVQVIKPPKISKPTAP